MKEFLDKVSFGDWENFRERGMKACGWTYDQWINRVRNRTQTSEAERVVLRNILQEMAAEKAAK